MKLKNLGILAGILLILTGCGSKTTLDLTKVETAVDQLTSDKLSIGAMDANIVETNVFPANMVNLYGLDEIGLTDELVDGQFIIAWGATEGMIQDETSVLSYVVVRPLEGKTKEVKEALTKFYDNLEASYTGKEDEQSQTNLSLLKKRTIEEVSGLVVAIVSENNAKVLEAIKTSYDPVFGMLQKLDGKDALDTIGIAEENLEEYLIKTPMMIVSSRGYYIVKPKQGKEDEVKKEIDEYFKKQEQQWSTYLPDQYELVKNRKEGKIGSYLVYIVSEDNDKVWNEIKKYTK